MQARVAAPPDGNPCTGAITELALASSTLTQFNRELLDYLSPIIGFDTACSVWTRAHDQPPHVTALGYAEPLLVANFPRYMNELTSDELAQITGPHASVDIDVISASRRDALAVYRELLVPHGVSSFITNAWHCRSGALGIHLARTGATPTLAGRPAELLQSVLPVVRLGVALLASEELAETEPGQDEWWAAAWGLSVRERDTARMVARGFRNGEVAQMLQVSPNTIRNHLASIFRKAEVSTRAELLFAMNACALPSGAPTGTGARDSPPWRGYVESVRRTAGQ